jgi:hypothetical protein
MNEDRRIGGPLRSLRIWNHAGVYNAWFCDLANYKSTAWIRFALETVCKNIGRCAIRCQLTQHWNWWLTKPDQSIHCLLCWSEIPWSRISTPGLFFLPIFKKIVKTQKEQFLTMGQHQQLVFFIIFIILNFQFCEVGR